MQYKLNNNECRTAEQLIQVVRSCMQIDLDQNLVVSVKSYSEDYHSVELCELYQHRKITSISYPEFLILADTDFFKKSIHSVEKYDNRFGTSNGKEVDVCCNVCYWLKGVC